MKPYPTNNIAKSRWQLWDGQRNSDNKYESEHSEENSEQISYESADDSSQNSEQNSYESVDDSSQTSDESYTEQNEEQDSDDENSPSYDEIFG